RGGTDDTLHRYNEPSFLLLLVSSCAFAQDSASGSIRPLSGSRPVYRFGFTLRPGQEISYKVPRLRVSDAACRRTGNLKLHSAPLRRPTAVVWNRGRVLDGADFDARGSNARIADSRPDPGPLTRTSTLRSP